MISLMYRNLHSSLRTLFVTTSFCATASVDLNAQSGPGKFYARIPTGAYSVVAEVRAKQGKADALRAATLPLVALVRNDPKNLVYFFQEDRKEPGHLVFYEVYATQADFDAHNHKPYVQAWFAKLTTLANGGVKTMKMEVLQAPAQP